MSSAAFKMPVCSYCICMYRMGVCVPACVGSLALRISHPRRQDIADQKKTQTQHVILACASNSSSASVPAHRDRIQYNKLLQHPSQCFCFCAVPIFFFPPTMKPRQRPHPPNLPRNAFEDAVQNQAMSPLLPSSCSPCNFVHPSSFISSSSFADSPRPAT